MLLDKDIDLPAISKVAGVEITNEILNDICNTNADVITLNMTSCQKLTDLGLASIGRHWKQLETLNIADCPNITHVGLRGLALNCRNLKTISFDNIDDPGLRIVAANLTNLEHIDLSGCQKVTDRGLSEVAHCCRKLRRLNLSGCFKIGESGIWGLCELVHCQGLQEIDLSRCTYLSDKGIWTVVKRCPHLVKINISDCPYLSGKVIAKVVSIALNLVDLAVSNTCSQWNSDDITMILRSCLDRIQHLDLSHCASVTKKEVDLICKCSHLVELKLSGCYIGDEDILMIDKSLVKLVTLEIFKCEISNDAVEALTPKKGGVGLSYLGLTGCDIVDVIFLETIASKFIFSAFINDDTFVGFQPIKSELESREHVRREYIQLLATTKIQRMIRGKLVRMGIYKEKKNKWAVENGIPKLQANFRRRKQVGITKLLFEERKRQNAAKIIQLAYQNYKWRQSCWKRLRDQMLQKKMNQATFIIQRYYRGHTGRRMASDRKYLTEIEKYRKKKLFARSSIASISIQSTGRGMLARTKVQKMRKSREAKRLLLQRQIMSATKLQRLIRGFTSRMETTILRATLDLKKKQLQSAVQIQCAWRVTVALQDFEKLRYFKNIEIHHGKAVKLQSVWRTKLARNKLRLARAMQDLKLREIHAALTMQRLYRGIRSRNKVEGIRSSIAKESFRNNTVIKIQRSYRGMKGRHSASIRAKLHGIEWKLKPVRESIKDLGKKLHKCDLAMKEIKSHLNIEVTKLECFENELSNVSKSSKPYHDSTAVNGVLQRCEKGFLEKTLHDKIERIKASIDKFHHDEHDYLEQSRDLRKETRHLVRTLEQMTAAAIAMA